ncbi:MAG: PhoPQ-activated pathogenicity-related family protein [Bacteroidales bacterium]
MKQAILFTGWLILAISCNTPDLEIPTTKTFPLKDYVEKGDPAFQYEIQETLKGAGWTSYQLRMISGNWLTEQEVEPSLWWHWLTIIVPDVVRENESMMFIGGGSAHDTVPPPAFDWLGEAAVATGSVISYLSNIPFQPVDFVGDTKGGRYEDDLSAYGWRQYLDSGASEDKREWLARFPMTRAVVRAMDVVQEVSASFGQPVEHFFVTGASKRGWTTWTTAAVDDRVVGIAPMVIDLLNIIPSFQHHWSCYGEWSPAVSDYVDQGIMDEMGSREFAELLAQVEPYSFLDRLTMPKLLINATCDEFFVTDSWQFYWDDLQGPSYLQYVPNVGHGLHGYTPENLISFYQAVITDRELPSMEWSVEDHTIHLQIDPSADYEISKWEAVNPEARDFRIYVNGEAWVEEPLEKSGTGTYEVSVSLPETGYKAAMLEVRLDPGSEFPLTFTSGTLVLPDTYPYAPFQSEDTP